ncbi:hypothetical protein F4774DRAFT_260064 [Daldinia eschscholtzii]|nr:hypothetical protein F4774DRAFT_260064 [Daldinia eschscholtzii]
MAFFFSLSVFLRIRCFGGSPLTPHFPPISIPRLIHSINFSFWCGQVGHKADSVYISHIYFTYLAAQLCTFGSHTAPTRGPFERSYLPITYLL